MKATRILIALALLAIGFLLGVDFGQEWDEIWNDSL